ncbi:oxygen-independent coproporphyrinogen-3 oxidase [Alkalibacillus filiformis]|uniref:Heme chaperone HemW n=1 Tax=Alkalibacillus filiformis TaxID=200990 RepID=A0ABU0DRK9_9BACI|nr:radical SAM family heme chaperone HemW [Alkalibacillus filiformis]MDQ0351075.1 oxygen-independent coproporphyrinogen-3 oxidase [Alkalibacillus filiformis]
MSVQAVYIHIPFCHEICHYCDFAKMYYHEGIADSYLNSLNEEISMYIKDEPVSVRTIYIGGGTPTSLNENQLEKLFQTISNYFNIEKVEEFTIEANPGEFHEGHVKLMAQYGINRVSLGVQVLDNDYLKEMNRIHTVDDVERSVQLLQQYGLTNISMDFIYALPSQTLEHFETTLKKALSFDLPHYSSYALQIEPKTVFYMRYQKGKLSKPKEEVEAQMFHSLVNLMEEQGLQHYEVSNFSKPGYESKHNLTYWDNVPYYAFGAGAHGYLNGERYVNLRPVNHYEDRIKQGLKPVLHSEIVTLKEQVEEEMFLGLRRKSGVSDHHFKERYRFSFFDLYQEEIDYLVNKEWIVQRGDTISMTHDGMLFGNDVFASFLINDDVWNKKFPIDSHS